MTVFRSTSTRPKRRRQDGSPHRLVTIPSFPQRHWITISLAIVLLLVGLGYLGWQDLSQECGKGMTATGSPYVCVGLDVDSTALRAAPDPLADLEQIVAKHNNAISGQFATIVVLDNMTPDPSNDIVRLQETRGRIEGAITAMSRENDPTTGGIPKIKLLLANYGPEASSWSQAVDAIEQATPSEHIVAVTGIGESLDATRAAVASLSDAGIPVVGASVTADNMNFALGGKLSENFFRVVPTNTEEAMAASVHIKQKGYHKVLLVNDVNEKDSYSRTLASAFSAAFAANNGGKVDDKETYRSPNQDLTFATRQQVMTTIFANMHSDICAIKPDLVYFAGRGIDLGYFLNALSSSGACGLEHLTVMTGDDGSDLVGGPIWRPDDVSLTVFYTALAYPNEWSDLQSGPDDDYMKNYQDFAREFTNENFSSPNLDDGQAMVSYDAVSVVINATREDSVATTEPKTVAAFLIGTHCQHFFPGASGPIAFDANDISRNKDYGNPIDKAMPILELHADGTVTQQTLAWPTGQPLNPDSTC